MPPSNLIECRIILLSTTEDAINIQFEVRNNAEFPVKILKRGTPLEGLRTNCLEVKANGVIVPYDGKMSKRAEPTEADYITLQPCETASNIVDITDAYNIPPNAAVEIKFDEDNLTIEPLEGEASGFARTLAPPQPQIINEGVQFENPVPPGKQTLGEQARESSKKKGFGLLRAAEVITRKRLKAPTFEGGTEFRQQKVLTAHKEAYKMIKVAIKNLQKTDDPNFIEWFDADDTPELRERVLKGFEAVKRSLERRTFTYDLSHEGCDPDDYAYTFKGDDTIWICSVFWPAPPLGMASKAGTIIHEHTHVTLGTDDFGYDKEACREMAINNPGKATRNADNFEFYAESLLEL